MDRFRVMIVDDHDVVRMGLKALIESEEDLEVVAEAENGHEAMTLAAIHTPDIVIMDVKMPDGSGVDACRDLRNRDPRMQVIMLTAYDDDEALFNSIMAGAAGYLLKGLPGSELADAIRTVGRGKALLDPDVTRRVMERIRETKYDDKDPKLSHLSPTEERVLDLIAEGLTNREIGERIHLSDKTVKNYVSSILQKLEVGRRAEAASYITRIKATHPEPRESGE